MTTNGSVETVHIKPCRLDNVYVVEASRVYWGVRVSMCFVVCDVSMCVCTQLCQVGLSAEWPKPQTQRIGT